MISMFSVYKKLFFYILERKGLAYLAIICSILSSVLMVGSLYVFYQFLEKVIRFQETEAAKIGRASCRE